MIKKIRVLDKYVGNCLCSLLGLFRKKDSLGKVKNILVIQLWGIGESILTMPAIKGLRKKFPEAKIYVLTTKRISDLFFLDKDVNKIIILGINPFSIISFISKNRKKFNLVVDFEEYLNISSIISFFAGKYRIGFSHGKRAKLYDKKAIYNDKQHVVKNCLDLVNLAGADYKTDELIKMEINTDNKNYVNNFLHENNINKKDFLIGIAPGAAESAKSRMWPIERFSNLADLLINKYKAKIIFVGSNEEIKLINKIQNLMNNKSINAAGKTNLAQLFYLIENCKLFISNDTGPMHIAAAQQVKTIGLFGPNLPARFGPYGKGNISVYKGAECSPCINVHEGQVPECRWYGEDYQKCMKKITVEEVLRAVEKIIK